MLITYKALFEPVVSYARVRGALMSSIGSMSCGTMLFKLYWPLALGALLDSRLRN